MKIKTSIFSFVIIFFAVILYGNLTFAQQDSYGSLENCMNEGNNQDYCCTSFQYAECSNIGSGVGKNLCTGVKCDTGYVCKPANGVCVAESGVSGGNGPASTQTGNQDTSNCNNDPNLTYSNGVCLPKDAGFAKTGFAGSTSLSDLMVKIIKFFLTFAGIVGVLILVIGGYWYLSSGGNEETAEKGKKAIINAIIGLVVVILAYTIVTIISSTLIADTFVK